MIVGQRDLRLLGAGEQVGLTAAAASSSSFGHRGPPWSRLHQPHSDGPVDPDFVSDRNDLDLSAQQGVVLHRKVHVQRPPGTFDHHRLDAFHVARDALRLGDAIARRLPRGYAALSDQLRRALLSAYLGIAEASSRQGQDRLARFRCARGEASEAAAAIEAVQVLALVPTDQTQVVLDLCDRLCAMLTRLSGAATGPSPPSRGR
jgi:four helix bundle protein